MEHFQQRKDLHARSRSRPHKGAVSEDLGRTQFIVGGGRRALDSSSKPSAASSSSESDDDLDAFSSKSKHISSSLQTRKVKALCGLEKNIPATKSLKKSRQKSEKIESTDVENESGSRRLRARKVSSKANGYEISQSSAGREKKLKTSSVKRKRIENPLPFPMETEHPLEGDKSSPKPAPFIIDVPSSKPSSEVRSLEPFPMDPSSSSKWEQWGTNSKPGAPRPFPMENSFRPSLSKCSDDDDDELKIKDNDMILTYGGPRPFPIPLSQITNDGEPASERRTLDEGFGKIDPKYNRSSGYQEFGEYSLRDADVDPSTICPYCDEPWPLTPSPTLLALLERAKSKSYADPHPGNALGLKAPLAVFVELCQRHRLEMTHLPLALARGWPTHIDFAVLPHRIGALKKKLKKLLDRPEKSQFWRDVRDDAKQVGSSKAVSITGQYATFERTQPGYYGEQGSIIIHQSLYSLFPSEIITPASVSPLTPDQFMTRVLVPETAVLLIKQDMRLSTKDEAMAVLKESKDYGATMFPEQMQGKDVEAVGEQLAKNRAKAKRKLLELRGETDADIRRALEEEGEKKQMRKVYATKKGLNAPGNVRAKRSADHGRVKDLDSSSSEESLGSKKESHYHVGSESPRKSSMTVWRSERSPSTSPVKPFEMRSTTSNLDSSQSDGNEGLTGGLKSATATKSAATSGRGRTHSSKAARNNDGGFGTASDKAEQTQKVKKQKGPGRKEYLSEASKSLGHTKRRKNRVADSGKLNNDSWLLSDASD